MMLSRRQSSGLLAVALCLVLMPSVLVSGQTFNITPGAFSSANVCQNTANPAASCLILTNGSPTLPSVISGGILRLNKANLNQHASAWFHVPQPLSTGFTTSFQFRISNTGICLGCPFPADGLAMVIQGDPAKTAAIGYIGNGQNIAYGNNDVSTASGPGNAILNSLAVELDTHQNTDYSDPNGNHIAVQSCGPNTSTTLSPNSADHNYQCRNGQLAKLALQSLPTGVSLSDGNIHTITVNYTPSTPQTGGSCASNLCVYLDSTLLLQTNLDITQLLNLQSTVSNSGTAATGAYIGFTAATGSLAQNNDIISWSFSQLPLAPITITQPLQPTTTNFNYTAALNSNVDYSNSGLPSGSFTGVFMQGTAQPILDTDFTALVNNTPFQGATCLHQDLGSGVVACVVTSDLCTNSVSSTPAGANCPNTGTNALITTSNTFNVDSSQKPFTNPGYLMAKDTALSCGSGGDNTCKGLQNIFQGISGDAVTLTGRTKDFNSLVIPVEGVLQPSTSFSSSPALNQGWINGPVTLSFSSIESTPSINKNPPIGQLVPTVASISYSATGANLPSPASGTITGSSGSIMVPGAVEGTTTITYQGLDSVGTPESITTDGPNNTVSTSLPTLTISVDLTRPVISGLTLMTITPALGQSVTASYSCSDGGSGVVLCGPTGSSLIGATSNTGALTSPINTSAPGVFTFAVNAQDLAGNTAGPSSVQYTVAQGTTTTTLASGVNPSLVGQAVTFSFTLTASAPAVTPAGTVSVSASTGESCSAAITVGACSITFTTAGSRTVIASYAGDTNYKGSASAQVSQVVNKVSTTTAVLSANPNPAFTGLPVTISFSVSGTTNVASPGGTVSVKSSTGQTCTGALSSSGPGTSSGSCALTFSSAGTVTISATYNGDQNFLSSSTTANTQINLSVGDFTITATPSSETISSGHQAVYTITVTPLGGLTGSVSLSCSGGPPNSGCVVSPAVDNLQGASINSSVTLSPNKNVTHGTFTLTFTGTYGGQLVHSVAVTLTVKGGS
jgi:hypothetical protein